MQKADRERWQGIADQMAKDNERRRRKDKELMEFIRANPGGYWDCLLKE